MSYRKRADFGLRRSFFVSDGPSCSIHVLNQKLESAFAPSFFSVCNKRGRPLLSSQLHAQSSSPHRTTELYSVSPIIFDTTVSDYWQRVSMCVKKH